MSTVDISKLRHLAIFAKVVECSSFAAAARKLNTSRSRVSEQVAQLEAEIGVSLFHRTTRQISLTGEGKRIYAEVKVLPTVLESVNDLISKDEPMGRVCLSLAHNIAHSHILPILDRFQEAYPNVYLDMKVTDQTSDLISEEIDLAIRTGIPKDSSMISRLLHEESLGIFASPQYLDRTGTPNTILELERHRWVSLYQASPNGSQKLYFDGKATTLVPQSYDTCNSPMTIHRMLLNGLGIGLLLRSSVRKEVTNGLLVPILPEVSGEQLSVTLMYPSKKQVPKRTRCLIDFLLSARLFR
ncbi:LysR family transcriptional regulator [Pseudovibrio sp. Tun.PSC04-5.I4]|uniref:LysR family transcriptional regulator n=1 Tax=Pseudovibrio sp. Tun.PSC04-5.I4 TaxID=1798213 RepID=UPI00088EF1A1|nr:LysR family transcriptional regulator [Pseudovibrio sp. Tun.PSC04-5.I4]SDQ14096.1 DNA-binding transcriptional regulator, LysR family [Pseudovibrio sp. Tun.PSC04-5.I4]